jgi:predicted ATPase/transcriptional regulator with XRE-family HTH domain
VADGPGATLAQLLKKLRLSAGLTQEELAEAAGISTRSVSDLERGVNRTTRKDTARLIADALGLSGSARELFEATARGRIPGDDQDEHYAAGMLPVPPAPLVGRAEDVRRVCGLMRRADVRLVTITGLGGVGKTRAALDIGPRLEADFPDGIFFVNLAPVRDSGLVMAGIAQATGIRDSGPDPVEQRVAGQLRPLRALLIIDNFEQVVDAAGVLAALLGRCPELKCLVTSRCALRLKGEHEHVLLPLQLPPADIGRATDLMRFAAVELFTQRVQAALPGWALTEDNAAAVAEVCRRLDGLPLALELAAARTKILTPAALLERLHGSLTVLSRGPRDSDDRHRTLQATLDWSHELLDVAAARLFRQLSVFAGGWTLDAMTRVCDRDGEIDTLDALASLIDNSLVWRAGRPEEARFAFPVTIREYAAEKLRDEGDADAVAGRHLAWCLDLAETAAVGLTGASQQSWLQVLTGEHANLQVALEHAITTGESAAAHRLGGALWRYWEINGHLAEGRRWLAQVLEMAGPTPAADRARAFKAAGNLARDQCDYDAAIDCNQRAHALFSQAGDAAGIAAILNNMGTIEIDRGDVQASIRHFEASLERFTELNDQWGVALVLGNLAHALRLHTEHYQAERIARESIRAFEALGDAQGTARSLATLGLILGRAGKPGEALSVHARAAALRMQADDRAGLARSLENIAWCQAKLGDSSAAAWLLGYAGGLREAVDVPLSADDRVELDETVAQLRSALDEHELTSLWSAGHDAPLTEALVRIGLRPEQVAGDRERR